MIARRVWALGIPPLPFPGPPIGAQHGTPKQVALAILPATRSYEAGWATGRSGKLGCWNGVLPSRTVRPAMGLYRCDIRPGHRGGGHRSLPQ